APAGAAGSPRSCRRGGRSVRVVPSPYLLVPRTVLHRNPVKCISKICATGELGAGEGHRERGAARAWRGPRRLARRSSVGDGALVDPTHPQQWPCVPCAPVVLMRARCDGPSLCTAQARVSDHDTSVSFFLGWPLLMRSTWPAIAVIIPSHFVMERSLFLGEEAQERLPTSGASLGHLRCGACPSPTAGLRYATKVFAMQGFHHLDGSQPAFRTGP